MTMFGKSTLAAIFISFGVCANFLAPYPVGPFLFAFGLLAVCYLDANLFTGKAGYLWHMGKDFWLLCQILLINLAVGYICGGALGELYPSLIPKAAEKIASWDCSIAFFIQAGFCGMIMYIAVDIFKTKQSIAGILIGVPVFIFCGFQHSIANIITLGICKTWDWSVLIAIVGNLYGSIFIDILKGHDKT